MEIFVVIKNTQGYDGDMWRHWVEKEIISYHTTNKGAKDKIQSYLKKDITKLKEILSSTDEYYKKSIEKNIIRLTKNKAQFNIDNNGVNTTTVDAYFVKTVSVEK